MSILKMKLKHRFIYNSISKNKILRNIFSKRCVRLVCCKLQNIVEKIKEDLNKMSYVHGLADSILLR